MDGAIPSKTEWNLLILQDRERRETRSSKKKEEAKSI
jgi:hypothetical protein